MRVVCCGGGHWGRCVWTNRLDKTKRHEMHVNKQIDFANMCIHVHVHVFTCACTCTFIRKSQQCMVYGPVPCISINYSNACVHVYGMSMQCITTV